MNRLSRWLIISILIIVGTISGGYFAFERTPVTDFATAYIIDFFVGGMIGLFVGIILSSIFWFLTDPTKYLRTKAIFSFVGIVVLFSLWLILRRNPVACDQIQELELRALLASEVVTLEQLKNHSDKLPIKDPTIEERYYGGMVPIATWSGSNGVQYLGFFPDGVLKYIMVEWSAGETVLKPTASEILDCFGEPDLVHIGAPFGWYNQLFLWYLDEGLIVSSASLKYNEGIPKISNGLIMWEMIIVDPGPVEQVSETLGYHTLIGVDKVEDFNIMEYIQSWPGSLEAIVSREK